MAKNNQEQQTQRDDRAKYILSLANQNLAIVVNQVESIDGKDYKEILKHLETVKQAFQKELE